MTAYVFIAKKTFEDDKIAYVFESQQQKLVPLAKSLNLEFEQFLFNAAAVAATFDADTGQLGPAGMRVFNQAEALQAIELIDGSGRSMLRIEKSPGSLDSALRRHPPGRVAGPLEISHDRSGTFLIVTAPEGRTPGMRLLARVTWTPPGGPDIVVLHRGAEVIFPEGLDPALRDFASTWTPTDYRLTATHRIGGIPYLVSTSVVGRTGLTLTSLIPESAALAALRLMFERSAYFLALSAFATVIISMLLAGGLVRNIVALTDAAERVQDGDLNVQVNLRANDEIGILGGAFNRMLGEIRRLLAETREKSRMESELKTARLVQDSLFPEKPWSSLAFELDGYYESATECGGDFWYYWENGRSLYFMIGDVTGHGAAAALLTSAMRATISLVAKTGESDLGRIADLAHQAVFDCSKGQRLMTAFFARLDLDTRQLDFVNCSHEPALRVHPAKPPEFVGLNPLPRLGDTGARRPDAVESLTLEPGDTFFLYTDGASEITDPADRRIREKIFLREVASTLTRTPRPTEACMRIADYLKDFSKKPLEDDLTMVALKVRFAAGFAADLEGGNGQSEMRG